MGALTIGVFLDDRGIFDEGLSTFTVTLGNRKHQERGLLRPPGRLWSVGRRAVVTSLTRSSGSG